MFYAFDGTVSKVGITAVVRSSYILGGLLHQWLHFKVTAGQRAFQDNSALDTLIKHYQLFLMSEYILDISDSLVSNSF